MFQQERERGCLENIIENGSCEADNKSECNKRVVEDSSKGSKELHKSDFVNLTD